MSSNNKVGIGIQPTRDDLIRWCTAIQNETDKRDWIVEAPNLHPSKKGDGKNGLSFIDRSRETGMVGHQGIYGSCIAWAVVRGLREWIYFHNTGLRVSLSVRFLWMASKEIDNVENNSFIGNAGSCRRTAFKILKK